MFDRTYNADFPTVGLTQDYLNVNNAQCKEPHISAAFKIHLGN